MIDDPNPQVLVSTGHAAGNAIEVWHHAIARSTKILQAQAMVAIIEKRERTLPGSPWDVDMDADGGDGRGSMAKMHERAWGKSSLHRSVTPPPYITSYTDM